MSLEDKVDGLIAAIEGLTAAVIDISNQPSDAGGPALAAHPAAAAEPEAKPKTAKPKTEKPKTAKKKAAKPAGPETKPAATEPNTTKTSEPPAAKTAATDGNLKELMSEVGAIAARLGPRGNELARILAGGPYNCVRISDLDPKLYTGFLKACQSFEATNP